MGWGRRWGGLAINSFMARVVLAGQDPVKFMTGNDNLRSTSTICLTVYIMSGIVFNYHYRGKSNCLIDGSSHVPTVYTGNGGLSDFRLPTASTRHLRGSVPSTVKHQRCLQVFCFAHGVLWGTSCFITLPADIFCVLEGGEGNGIGLYYAFMNKPHPAFFPHTFCE